MADTRLKLEVIMAAVDKLTAPLKSVMAGSKGATDALRATRAAVKELEDAQSKLDKHQKARTGAQDARNYYMAQKSALDALKTKYEEHRFAHDDVTGSVRRARMEHKELMAQFSKNDQTPGLAHKLYVSKQELEKLEREYVKHYNSTRRLKQEVKDGERAVDSARQSKDNYYQALKRSTVAMRESGVDVRKLADHQSNLKTKIEAATAASEKQAKALQSIHAARANYDKASATQGKLAGTGVGAMATGGAIMFGLGHSIEQAGHYQQDMLRIKALGMGDHVVEDSDKFARGMHKYGTSMRDNIDLMRDGLTIFADIHHAEMAVPVMQKMKFANAALFGEKGGEKTDQLYDMLKVVELRGGAKDAKTFEAEANLIQKVMSSTGGRVGSKDYRELIQTGGVASKQLSTDTFYNVLEPMIQEMGGHQVGTGLMSAFQNLYLGKSTTAAARTLGDLDLVDKSKVEYDKVGQIKRMKTGALVGAETYKTNPFEWLETTFLPALAKKGITDPSAVRDMLATVVGSRTGAKVLTTYLDQRDQIQKAAGRNRNASGIDETYAISQESVDGKKMALAKRFDDVQQLLGEKLLPVYSRMLDMLQGLTDGLANFAQAHPNVVKWLGYAAATIGTLLVVFGALALGVAAVIGPFALLKLSMAVLGVNGFGVVSMAGKLWGALKWVGTAVLWLGRLMLANPILAVVAAIAAAAIYVWANWDTLGPKFAALWASITNGAASAWAYVTSLPGKFATMGGQVIDGFMSGLSAKWEAAKAWFADMGNKIAQATRDALGIKSPSRVFAEIGGHVMGGLSMGLDNGEEGPLDRVKTVASKVAALGAGITIGAGAMAMPIDTRPPLSAGGSAGQGGGGGTVIQITVNPSAGMDESALAKLVAQEVERVTRKAQVASRSRLTDSN